MKTLKSIFISGLLTIIVIANLNAAELVGPTSEMNLVLQSQIEKRLEQTLQAKSTVASIKALANASAVLSDIEEQKINASRS